MDELEFYDGAYTGPQIDAAIAKVNALPAASYTLGGVRFTFRKSGRIVVVGTYGSNTDQLATNAWLGGTTAAVASDFLPLEAEVRYEQITGTVTAQFNLASDGTFRAGLPSATLAAGTNWRGTFTYVSAS